MSKRILIVDDELNMRMLLKETLVEFEDKGVELLTAENGDEGVEIVRTENLELIILDVMMPEMNGFEVCDIVKNNLGMKDVCVLALTVDGQESNKQKSIEAGAHIFLI